MKRVCIIGSPGSGKSTFARRLAEITGLPLCHLDLLYHNADRTTVSREVFSDRLDNVLAQEDWIIDGNYSATMERRLALCDTVFFFDLPVEVCLSGVAARQGKVRPDMPWIEVEEDPEFTDYIRRFPADQRPRILERLETLSADASASIFHSREDAHQYLDRLAADRTFPAQAQVDQHI